MVRFTACVFVGVLGVILASDPWWVTGSPFKHTTTPRPLKWFISDDGRQRSCQCSQPHFCRDYITLKSSTDAVPTCPKGEVCCDGLKQAAPYDEEDIVNGVIPSKFEEDVGGDQDSPEEEEDPDELYTDSGKESDDESPPIVIPKFTEEDEDVVDLDELTGSSEDKPDEFQCGVATAHLIIDDKQAADPDNTRFAQYPWNLVILYTESGTSVASCGATLIEPAFAITAAHCVAEKDLKRMTVRAGEWDLNDEDETFPHEDRTIKSITIHERYQKYGLHNDIAFIELSSPFKLSPHIGTLCPPAKKELVKSPCIATGWGMRDDVSPSKQSKMKAVEVKLEKAKNCQEKLQRTDLGPNFRLSNTSMCATAVRKHEDTSIGDGGGPLFCKSTDGSHFIFVGITSWGKLKYPNAPGVYTAVKQYSDWIEELMMKALGMFKSNT